MEPVNKNLEIKLPLKAEKIKDPQENDTHINHLMKQWKKATWTRRYTQWTMVC